MPFPSTLFHQLVFHPPLLHLAIYFLIYLSALLFPNSYTVKPVKLTTFIRWPPTDVDHISVEPVKFYIVCIYDHLSNFSIFICWISVYVSHAKWNRGTVLPAYIDHGSTSGQSNGASLYVSSRWIAFSCSNRRAVLLPVCIEFTGERYCTCIVVEEEIWQASKINKNSKHETKPHDKWASLSVHCNVRYFLLCIVCQWL